MACLGREKVMGANFASGANFPKGEGRVGIRNEGYVQAAGQKEHLVLVDENVEVGHGRGHHVGVVQGNGATEPQRLWGAVER